MLYEAADQFQKAYAAGDTKFGRWRYEWLEEGNRAFPSIWEERMAGVEASAPALSEGGQMIKTPKRSLDPPATPDAPTLSETPRGVETSAHSARHGNGHGGGVRRLRQSVPERV